MNVIYGGKTVDIETARRDLRRRIVPHRSPPGWIVLFDGHTIGENPRPKGYRNTLADVRRLRKRMLDIAEIA